MSARELRLPRRSLPGIRWAWLVEAAEPFLREVDPWRLYPVNLRVGEAEGELPLGPVVYAALGADAWEYCGLTLQPLQKRLRGHGTDSNLERRSAKADRWITVAALALKESTPAQEIGRLERKGKELLRPRMGRRWSRGL